MSVRRLEWTLAALAVVLAVVTVALRYQRDHADHATDYVEYTSGALPVVLVVPHDGDRWRSGLPARAVTPRRDNGTRALAGAISDALFTRTGSRPHIVALRMDRRQLDANRRPADAYEHARAADVYDAFHARIAELTHQLAATDGDVLVLDLHGNWEFPADLYLGTDDGRSVAAGPPSIDERMRDAARAAGFEVATAAQTPETLRGDFIVGQYGHPDSRHVQAVMVEVHGRVRESAEATQRMASATAEAIVAALPRPEVRP